MLDRSKLMHELTTKSKEIFVDSVDEHARAYAYWQKIVADEALQQKIRLVQSVGSIPTWTDLDGTYGVLPISEYHVLAVDGSQIYPDRHQGVSCYLINTGNAYCFYGPHSCAEFSSQPLVARGTSEWGEISPDIVDCIRTEHELHAGLIKSREYKKKDLIPFIFLFDGSIIFWHLESKDEVTKSRFLTSYLTLFQQLYDEKSMHAGFISLPKSRELVHIVAAAAKILNTGDTFAHSVDTDIVRFFLKPGMRTEVFKNNSSITSYYPALVQPHFFYLNTAYEIVRIEIPAWIAANKAHVDSIASVALDQVNKGYGYPVCLAEAHEQAVVKGADREFFYLLLQKMAHTHKRNYSFSQKSIKKRSISV